MIETLLSIVIALAILGVLIWATRTLCAAFGVPNPVPTVIIVIFVLVFLVWLARLFGVAV